MRARAEKVDVLDWNNSSPPLKNETVKLSQETISLFPGAAISTGGQLSDSKTKWYLLEFIWDTIVRWRLEDHSTDLTIDYHNCRITIQRIQTSEAYRFLGVWITPNGSSQEQTYQIRKIKHHGQTDSGQATSGGNINRTTFKKLSINQSSTP